jgi:hypothetical protein
MQIFKNDSSLNWRYEGALHEYAACNKPVFTNKLLEGDYYIESNRLGERSADVNKYLKDAFVFEQLLKEDPNNSRSIFYCARSYFDHKDYENAIRLYKKRIELGGWFEEVFYSYYQIANAYEVLKTKSWKEIEHAYLCAYNFCKLRAEPLYRIACHYREEKDYKTGYRFAKIASLIPYPEQLSLFIYRDVYDYKILVELMLCCSCSNDDMFQETIDTAKKILDSKLLPKENIGWITNIIRTAEKNIENENIYQMNSIIYKKEADVIEQAEFLTSQEKYNASYNLINDAMDKPEFSDIMRDRADKVRDRNIAYFKDIYLLYNTKKIKNIKEHIKEQNKQKIIIGIFTYDNRINIFEKTVNSFINCCNDHNLIDSWVCVDANSTEENRTKMKELYPFFNFIWINDATKNYNELQIQNMNIIRNISINKGSEYLIYLQDNWHFIQKRNYIAESINLLNENETYGQLVFNNHYAEFEPYKMRYRGGILMHTKDTNKRYMIHEYYNQNTKEGKEKYDNFIKLHSQNNTHIYTNVNWPHFTFRPSIMRVNMLNKIGGFLDINNSEMIYGKLYVARGYVTIFMDTFNCLYIS